MSLYAEYLEERGVRKIIENEYGFATYSPYKNGICIEDIYVKPLFRQTGIGSDFHESIIKFAKEQGHKKIYTCVAPGVKSPMTTPTGMVKWMFSRGYELDDCFGGALILVKDLE